LTVIKTHQSIKIMPKKLIIKMARNGKGIFAAKAFKQGEIIETISGKLVHHERASKLWDENARKAENLFRYCGTRYLSPEGELGDYSNHSCNPNSGVIKNKGKLFWIAINDIKRGQETLIDYSTIIGADDAWTMKCNCGEKECRKIIRSIDKLPKKILDRYLKLGIIPRYILNTMKKARP